MMQRLLRGRILYVVLGGLILLLYLRAIPGGLAGSAEAPSHPKTNETLEWWPRELDTAGLQRIVEREPRLALVLLGLTVFIVGMGFGGFALLLWGVWTGRIRSVWRFPQRRLPHWSFGELGRIVLFTAMMASLLPFVRVALLFVQVEWASNTHLWMSVSMVVLDVLLILTILAFAVGKGSLIRQTFGLSGRHLPAAMALGLRSYMAVFPWLFVFLYVIVAVGRFLHLEPPIEPIHELIFHEHHPAAIGMTVLLACLIGPIAEELFFRGVVYAAIRQRTSRAIAMLTSGAVFSLIHTNLLGFLPIMILGCVLAYLYERTGSLTVPLAVHILHNTFLMALALTFRHLMSPG